MAPLASEKGSFDKMWLVKMAPLTQFEWQKKGALRLVCFKSSQLGPVVGGQESKPAIKSSQLGQSIQAS